MAKGTEKCTGFSAWVVNFYCSFASVAWFKKLKRKFSLKVRSGDL